MRTKFRLNYRKSDLTGWKNHSTTWKIMRNEKEKRRSSEDGGRKNCSAVLKKKNERMLNLCEAMRSKMLNFDAVWIVVISHKWSADLVRTTISVFSKRVALAYNWFLIYCSGMSSCHIWAEPSMSTSLMISFFAFSIA